MFERLIGLIAPYDCLCCGTEGALLCQACRADLPPPAPCCYKCRRADAPGFLCGTCESPLEGISGATRYEGLAKGLIARLKFERAATAAKIAAEVMAAKTDIPEDVIVSFVPTADRRVRMRGYDQARLIAKHFATTKGLPYAPLLLRLGHERQLGRPGKVRRRQLEGAFRFRGAPIGNRHILLIDDVLTTGSTLEAAAAVLKRAGAASVRATVFAIA